jgi:hypothetical protein
MRTQKGLLGAPRRGEPSRRNDRATKNPLEGGFDGVTDGLRKSRRICPQNVLIHINIFCAKLPDACKALLLLVAIWSRELGNIRKAGSWTEKTAAHNVHSSKWRPVGRSAGHAPRYQRCNATRLAAR